jgi:hypothetical protein
VPVLPVLPVVPVVPVVPMAQVISRRVMTNHPMPAKTRP